MTAEPAADLPAYPTLREATMVWLKIGLTNFGGPAGQIALMHRDLVEARRWISESRFLHALNFCMLLPGPEAQQLATYVGWLLHGWRGGVIAGTLFVLPGLAVIIVLAALYSNFGNTTWLTSLFFGLKAAVLAIVIEAVIRVGRRALRNRTLFAIAALAFLALFAFNLPFPVVVLSAGIVGLVGARVAPTSFAQSTRTGTDAEQPALIGDRFAGPVVTRTGTLKTALIWILLWLAPLVIILPFGSKVYLSLWTFFSQMAIVTFGGAYAVLAYVAQEAVQGFGWLQPGEMIDGLALAETTPGPLVLVLSFVGFLASFRASTGLDPLLAGIVGAALTAWVTFVPCFLWIFLGAPYVELLRSNAALSGALAAIAAAVVGVILNLAIWFGLHVLFREIEAHRWGVLTLSVPNWASISLPAVALGAVAALALFRLRLGIVGTLALCGALGVAVSLVLPVS